MFAEAFLWKVMPVAHDLFAIPKMYIIIVCLTEHFRTLKLVNILSSLNGMINFQI